VDLLNPFVSVQWDLVARVSQGIPAGGVTLRSPLSMREVALEFGFAVPL
jgi:hypothetical protein